ncbi:hypothetical protein ACN2LU_004282 [Vibrio vulnificus]|nr:hypothetical protein [Vibrio vulnificus]EHZ2756205.1 hypothetical protein [Vibrio vulnificus]EHZ2765293.1 hypothetical protein [Vibrio vulnificus]EKD8805031.1 hypothetical protein [Vibrio vulnificus]EKD9323399.1 hypothetical protein [Vibrio vulnificus]
MTQTIRFIKLGSKGKWEASCIADGTIRLGYNSPMHEQCLEGNWDKVREHWLSEKSGSKESKRVVTGYINQIRSFYEAEEDDIWVTFYQRKLYWCKAHKHIEKLDDGSRIRKVVGAWNCNDLNGKKLTVDNIDGRITKVQGYRGTICGVELPEYLDRKIKGEQDPTVLLAEERVDALTQSIIELIKGLWWYDFELLVDLVFSKSGWHRYSVLGKTEKDLDLDLFSPTTNRRAFAQIKSQTNQSELEEYCQKYASYDNYQEFFFIYHTSKTVLDKSALNVSNVHVLGDESLAKLVISTGLVHWLIEKRT